MQGTRNHLRYHGPESDSHGGQEPLQQVKQAVKEQAGREPGDVSVCQSAYFLILSKN